MKMERRKKMFTAYMLEHHQIFHVALDKYSTKYSKTNLLKTSAHTIQEVFSCTNEVNGFPAFLFVTNIFQNIDILCIPWMFLRLVFFSFSEVIENSNSSDSLLNIFLCFVTENDISSPLPFN